MAASRSGVGIALRANSAGHAHPYLFGEDQGRYLLAVSDPAPLLEAAKAAGVHASLAGTAGGDEFSSPELFSIALSELRAANEGWLPNYMSGVSASVAG